MGELKKRLKDTEYDGTDISETGVTVVESSDVLKWWDEAKKEYPIWDNSNPKSRLTEKALLGLVKKKDAWFKKWFGKRE